MAHFLDSYRNQRVLITGGSSGIGRALALLLAQGGAKLWLIARRREPLLETQQLIGENCDILPVDVSQALEVEAAIAHMRMETDPPDLIINSAGVAHPGYVQDLPFTVFREMIDINYLGTVHVVKALLPGMIRRQSGTIVNISSVAGFIGVFGYTAYGASKFAVRGFTDALRAEMKPLGIHVSLVFHLTRIPPNWPMKIPLSPRKLMALAGNAGLATPEAVAEAILKGSRRSDT